MNTQTESKPSYFLSPGVGVKQNYDVVDFIKSNVSSFFKVEQHILFSKSRKRELVWPRQIAAFLIKKYTKLSLQAIGAKIGGKDHATVLYSIKVVRNLTETDKHLREMVILIDQMITNGIANVYQAVIVECSKEFDISVGKILGARKEMSLVEYQAYCAAVWVLQSVKKTSDNVLAEVFSITPEKVKILLEDKHHFTRSSQDYLSSLLKIRQLVSTQFASNSLKIENHEDSI